jgi:folate-binding protein YgfZ
MPHPGGDPAMVPLLDRAWLIFRGSDARQFLHDQLTAGVADIPDSETRLASYCSPQGRVLALFRVTGDADDGLRVELPAALAESISRRLKMFVLRADVRIEHAADITALGCWGDGVIRPLESSDLPVPDGPFQVGRRHDISVTRLPGPTPRFQLTGPPAWVTEIWQQWRTEARPANTVDWQYLDVQAGLPDIGTDTTDQFLPQSLGLEHWHAVSLRKGCYPGQEVIARAHYRGRLKRHLYRAVCEGAGPDPGMDVVDDGGKRVGTIVSAAPGPEGNTLVLAVMHERASAGCRLGAEAQPGLRNIEPVFA